MLNTIKRFVSSVMQPAPTGIDLSLLPNDILLEVFLHLPASSVVRCAMCCKKWHDIICTHSFWFLKCRFDNYLSNFSLDDLSQIPVPMLQRCITFKAFERNLINDDYYKSPPLLDMRWSDANINRRRVGAWKVESPPMFLQGQRENTMQMDECDRPFESCMVSSYNMATRSIVINLLDYGLTQSFIDEFKPTIVVREFYTNRADCSCSYSLETVIRGTEPRYSNPDWDDDDDPNGRIQNGMWRRFEQFAIDQWEDQYWRKVEYEVRDYPKGTCVVEIVSKGKDGQFWAGSYGVKAAGTTVMLKFDFQK